MNLDFNAALAWLLMDSRPALERYHMDAEFHAAVYRAALVLSSP